MAVEGILHTKHIGSFTQDTCGVSYGLFIDPATGKSIAEEVIGIHPLRKIVAIIMS